MTAQSAELAARAYAANGWRVIPLETVINGRCTCWRGRACRSAGKHPRLETGEQHAAATTDPELISEWWAHWPNANVGIATGKRSGLVVLDVDPGKGGNQSLETLLPISVSTLSVVTGSGGVHLYYQHPGKTVACRVGFRPGLDLRADGGLIVAPPSRHKSGAVYAFVDASTPIMPMPAELVCALAPAPPTFGLRGMLRPFRGTLTPYAAAALDRECAELALWPKGTEHGRHGRIFKVAAQLGELVAGGTLPRPLVVAHVLGAADACGAVADYGENHVLRQIEAGLSAGEAKPRSQPDGASIPWVARPPVTEWAKRPEVTTWKR